MPNTTSPQSDNLPTSVGAKVFSSEENRRLQKIQKMADQLDGLVSDKDLRRRTGSKILRSIHRQLRIIRKNLTRIESRLNQEETRSIRHDVVLFGEHGNAGLNRQVTLHGRWIQFVGGAGGLLAIPILLELIRFYFRH